MPFEPDAEGGAVPNRQASIGNTRDWRKTILALEHFSSEPASHNFAIKGEANESTPRNE
jgi:hypothetical protein